ncbi:MAG: hypothetical protein U1E73_08905 [Planctomycetota bacterium]
MKPTVFRSFAAAAFGLVAATALPGQDQATHLAAACQKADVLVVATVTATTDPSPEWHRLEFRADDVLRGNPGATFALMEPAGACCGRSLFALAEGEQRLLLLQRTGAVLHPFGGGRGVLPVRPAVLAHVRALLQANTDAQRTAVLLAALAGDEPRLADDAAHALAAMPQLALDAGARTRVATALRAAVELGSPRAAALLDVAVRTADAAMLDAVLPLYLGTPRADQARLLRSGLARVPSALAIGRLPGLCGGDRDRELRAAELLCAFGDANATAALSSLLATTQNPRVQLCAAEGLLAAGTDAAALRARVPARVLALAQRRAAGRPLFRAIPDDLR